MGLIMWTVVFKLLQSHENDVLSLMEKMKYANIPMISYTEDWNAILRYFDNINNIFKVSHSFYVHNKKWISWMSNIAEVTFKWDLSDNFCEVYWDKYLFTKELKKYTDRHFMILNTWNKRECFKYTSIKGTMWTIDFDWDDIPLDDLKKMKYFDKIDTLYIDYIHIKPRKLTHWVF